jgi:hypothetical protein
MFNRIIPLLIALQCAGAMTWSAKAQQAMEAVTKTVTREIQVSPGDIFRVVAEKADVKITGWDKKQVQARIVFSAAHPDRKIAAREIAYMQYTFSREADVLEFMNAFVLPANTDVIQSKLEVSLEFMVPSAISLDLEAKYSNTAIVGVTGVTDADLEFSDLELNRIGGSVTLKATFSEIRGESMQVSSFRSDDSRSQFSLNVAGGAYVFQSRYSKLDLTLKSVRGLTIDGVRTDVVVRTEPQEAYRYDLRCRSGKVYVPAVYERYLKNENKQITLQTPADAGKPLIRISTTFDTITIK